MSYTMKKVLANKKNYGSKRSTGNIKYLVYHYTANDGDTDEANANYFKNNVVGASAHYFVDDDSVTQSVPDDYVAWHCGGGLQGKSGHTFHGKCTNSNSIGIEMCDTIKNGKHDISARTRANAIALGKSIIKKYNIPVTNIIRHYDVTGKNCPAYYVSDSAAWKKFKAEITTTATEKKGYSGDFPSLGVKGYLKLGDKGDNVLKLQSLLNWCLGTKLVCDGCFGKLTKEAVEKFQKKYGLTVDGYFGKKSLEKAKTIKK